MTSLTDHLRRQVEQNRVASYFNIDILKYQVQLFSSFKQNIVNSSSFQTKIAQQSLKFVIFTARIPNGFPQEDFLVSKLVAQVVTDRRVIIPEQKWKNVHAKLSCIYLLQVKSGLCMHSIPLHLLCYWKCEQAQTDFRLDYKFNRSQRGALGNVNVLVPVDGEVTHMQSKPTATW